MDLRVKPADPALFIIGHIINKKGAALVRQLLCYLFIYFLSWPRTLVSEGFDERSTRNTGIALVHNIGNLEYRT